MEVLQAQLASDLNSNCYLVLMNEVLKSGWMIEYNNTNNYHHHNHNEKLLSQGAEDVGDFRTVKEAENLGAVHTVIEIDDDDSSPEDEPSCLRTPGQRKGVPLPFISVGGESTEPVGKHAHYTNILGGGDTESRNIELYEKEKDCGSGPISNAVAPTRGPGPYQRPARIIQSPDWLPDGWTTEIRIRELGNTAGTKDKYYVAPSNGRRFRSKKEVMEFLQTGNLSRWKRKAKPTELNGHCPPFAASVAQVECPSAALQNWSISPFAWGPLQVANNYVDVGSVPYNGGIVEKNYSAGSWLSTNQQNNVFHNGSYHSGHILRHPLKADFVPQISFHPEPVEIIDLEAIPDMTPSIETRPVSKNLSQLNPPKEVSMSFAESKGQDAKDFSPQLQSYDKDKQYISEKKHFHTGVGNILGEGNANNLVESYQVPKCSVSYGANSCQRATFEEHSPYVSCVADTHHYTVSGEPSRGFTSIAAFDDNRLPNAPQIRPLPSLGLPLGSGTPVLWQYRMLLPSFAGNRALNQTFGQVQSPASRLHENDVVIGTKTRGQVQSHIVNQHFEKDSITRKCLPEQRKKSSTAPLGVKKFQKLKRHQEKKQLELLGKKLCRQGLAFMRIELPT